MTGGPNSSSTINVSNGEYGIQCGPYPFGCTHTSNPPETFLQVFHVWGDGGGSSMTAKPYNYHTPTDDYVTRAAGVLRIALGAGDFGMLDNTIYKVWANEGCIAAGTGDPGDACYSAADHALKLGFGFHYLNRSDASSSVANGPHTTFTKSTIAYEFGHFAQYTTWRSLSFDYGCTKNPARQCVSDYQQAATPAGPKQCKCDYITTGKHIHCL